MNDHHASVPAEVTAPPIRYRIAAASDVDAIHDLIEEASRTTTVLPRPRRTIQENLDRFVVAERDGRIVGCGSLALFTPYLAEVRSLVVADGLRGRGVGGAVVRALVEAARQMGVRRVFALTDNPAFFQRLDFTLTDKSTLPHKVWNECARCPKFLTCTEEAVDMLLCPEAADDPSLHAWDGDAEDTRPQGPM